MNKFVSLLLIAISCSVESFTVPRVAVVVTPSFGPSSSSMLRAESSEEESPVPAPVVEMDPMEEQELDSETLLAMEKARRADELRAQEVFMTKSTGKFECTNCDWEFDEDKGDTMMIGGQIKPGTKFEDLPSNWRCPVCRASKDSFREKVIEIPGFEVNQGYGLGGNSMTSDQKNSIIFGGLFVFFVLFLSGYGLS